MIQATTGESELDYAKLPNFTTNYSRSTRYDCVDAIGTCPVRLRRAKKVYFATSSIACERTDERANERATPSTDALAEAEDPRTGFECVTLPQFVAMPSLCQLECVLTWQAPHPPTTSAVKTARFLTAFR